MLAVMAHYGWLWLFMAHYGCSGTISLLWSCVWSRYYPRINTKYSTLTAESGLNLRGVPLLLAIMAV